MPIKNNKGSSLLENVMAIAVFSIVAMMIFSSFLAGYNLTGNSSKSYTNRNDTFNNLEQGMSSYVSDGVISFSGGDVSMGHIPVSYYYDTEADIVAFEYRSTP